MEVVLLALLGFCVVGSLVALQMRDLLSAVIAVGVVGLGLSILFLLLGAPDIAITQVVVEVIMVTVMIRLTSHTGREEPVAPRRDRFAVGTGLLLLAAVLAFTAAAFAALPEFGANRLAPATWYLQQSADMTGAANVVTAILLDFRGYDTLGEATVILVAVVGVMAVLRRVARPGAAAPSPPPAEPAAEQTGETAEVTHG